MKLVVIKQHFDIKPGTVLTYLEHSLPETNMYGCMYFVAQHPAGYKVTIPNSKVLLEENSPFETINS